VQRSFQKDGMLILIRSRSSATKAKFTLTKRYKVNQNQANVLAIQTNKQPRYINNTGVCVRNRNACVSLLQVGLILEPIRSQCNALVIQACTRNVSAATVIIQCATIRQPLGSLTVSLCQLSQGIRMLWESVTQNALTKRI
jgi:hypothetical protein